MDKKNKLIIRGETLAQTSSYDRVSPPFNKIYEKSLEESQQILLEDLRQLRTIVNETEEDLRLPEYYFKVTLPETFKAKSYKIDSLYLKSNLIKVGSFSEVETEDKRGTSDIVKGTDEDILNMLHLIESPDTKELKKEIRRIDSISNLEPIISEYSNSNKKTYELSFYGVAESYKEELVDKIKKIIGEDFSHKWVPVNDYHILYINTKLDSSTLGQLSDFNVLRSAQEISSRRSIQGKTNDYNKIRISNESKGSINIGMIDGGVDTSSDYFRSVEQYYSVTTPPSLSYINHGNSVASTILYGDLSEIENSSDTLISSKYHLISIRGLPSEEDGSYNLIDLEQIISDTIPKYPNVKIWNLSVGPVGPIHDDFVSSFTHLLDQLAYIYDVIFVIAVGNTGNNQGLMKRIQVPADSVNNIAITAYYNDNQNNKEVAPYSSIGPGREGAKLKPDFIDKGGLLPINPVRMFDGDYSIVSDHGTSFATPLAARKLARLSSNFPEMTATQIRALAEHSVVINNNYNDTQITYGSKGVLPADISEYIESDETEVRLLYNGVISAKGIVKLPIPIPEDLVSSKIKFTWTLVIKTPVNIESPDKYTQYSIEDKFIPNERKFRFYNAYKKSRIADEEDEEKIATLRNEGYTQQSRNPVTDSAKLLNESELIDEELKWDTAKTRTTTKMTSGLKNPYIRLHGVSRDDDREQFEYSLVLTMKFQDDLDAHSRILQENRSLREITIQSEIQDNIQIEN